MVTTYENKLYDDKVTLVFEGRRHRYIWEEKDLVVKSVTTALKIINKPALIHWASNMAVDYIMERILPGEVYDEMQLAPLWEEARWAHETNKVNAGKLGTFMHEWIESYIKGKKPQMPVNERLQKSCRKFLGWVEKHDVKFLLSEQVVFSQKYMYCGTSDFICVIDGQKYIGDLKTSSGIYPEMLIQVAAYRYAREEEFPAEKYDGQLVIRIGREDGTLEVGICKGKPMYYAHFKAFVYALSLSNSMDSLEKFVPDKE